MKKERLRSFLTLSLMLYAFFTGFSVFGFTAPSISGGAVVTIARDSSGNILIGGNFTKVDDQTQEGIARLTSSGTLDDTFITLGLTSDDPYAQITVNKILVLPSGKMLVAGTFDSVTSGATTVSRNSLVRLNSDSTIDTSFPNIFDEAVTIRDMIYDSTNSEMLVVGDFTHTVGSDTFNRVLRINDDGSVDTVFNPSPNDTVFSVCLDSSSKVVLGGAFTSVSNGTGTTTRNYLARFNYGGSLDTGFNPSPNSSVNKIVATGSDLFVAGSFTSIGGYNRNLVAKLDSDGDVITAFSADIDDASFVNQIIVDSSGQIYVGGNFSYQSSTEERYGLARLTSTGSIDTSFNVASFFLYDYDLPCGLYMFSDESALMFGGLIQGGSFPMGVFYPGATTSQTITFPTLSNKVYGDDDFAPGATSSSSLSVSYKVISGQRYARIQDGEIHITGVGSVTIAATQIGNSTYKPAPVVTQSFTISKADQTITIDDIEDQPLAKGIINPNVSASSKLKVTLAITGPAQLYTFTQTGVTAFGQDLGDLSVPTSLIEFTGTGTVTVTATQAGNENYNAATQVVRTFDVI